MVFEPRFLVGAFLKKRVDYSHGFSSVFFTTIWSDQNSSSKSSTKFWEEILKIL